MSVHAVKLYKLFGTQWVFDDPAKDIWAEAFVSGADDVCDMVIKKKYGRVEPERHYVMRFSNEDFPGATSIEYQPRQGIDVEKDNDTTLVNSIEVVDSGSYWVYTDENNKDHLLWLCNTLGEYFTDDDKLLYFDIVM